MRRSNAVLASTMVALGLTVAGCTDDPKPPPTPTTSSATSTPGTTTTTTTSAPPTTTSATSAAPTGLPDAAKQNTPAGAVAFARFFIDELTRAWTIPDGDALDGLCLPTSKACASYAATAQRLEANKRRYDRKPFTVSAANQRGVYNGAHRVEVQGVVAAANVVDSSGKVIETYKQEPLELGFYIRWQQGRWVIESIKRGTI